jgi:hypothetical protein
MATTAKSYRDPTSLVLALPSGSTALVDDRDWHREFTVTTMGGNRYTARPCDLEWRVYGGSVRASIIGRAGLALNCRLERLITEALPGQVVRFKNGNWRDCRRVNLEVR